MTILLGIALGLWALGFCFVPRLRPLAGTKGKGRPVSLSVIIPARNEEHNLPRLLRSLAEQPEPPLEVIVVDDGSTDRTAELARELGAKVVTAKRLPEGWRGKTWACHQGAESAKGSCLLFVDADTWFEPGGLARILSGYSEGAFSVGPYHAVEGVYEDLSLFFNFNMVLGTVPQGLFGQMLLIDRRSYGRTGGHEAVRARILENFFLAEELKALGMRVASAVGRGSFAFRMYPNGLRELIEGWTKGFASGAGRTPNSTMLLIVLWTIGLMLAPVGWALAGGWLPFGGLYLLCAAQVCWFSRRVGSFGWWSAVCYPVPLVFFFLLFTWSAWRSGKNVRWKGREVRAD